MTEQEFKQQILLHHTYHESMLEAFFDYWSEPNKKGKMRFELEKTWDLSRRLKRWHNNNLNWNKNANSTTKTGTSQARIDALRTWGA